MVMTSEFNTMVEGFAEAKASLEGTLASGRYSTAYSHSNVFNYTTNTFECDCSGLIMELLRRARPDIRSHMITHIPDVAIPPALNRIFKNERPLVVHMWYYLAQHKDYFQEVDFADMRPGDILIELNPVKQNDASSSGHIMLINNVTPIEKRGVVTEWIVAVLDSTSKPHNPDTRGNDKKFATGLGVGSIKIKRIKQRSIDGNFTIGASWTWGSNSRTPRYKPLKVYRPLFD